MPRSTSRPPLVEVIFNIDREPETAEFAGATFTCARNPKRAMHFDLFFNVVEGAHSMTVECDYNTSLFRHDTIHRWLSHYQTLLEGIAANAAEPLATLPLLTAAQRGQLTVEWNEPQMAFAKDRTIDQWFETQAEQTPEAHALSFNDTHLTYGQVNQRANQLASYLKGLGAGPDHIVGLFVEHSPEMLIAIVGILKAGAAYLPSIPVTLTDVWNSW